MPNKNVNNHHLRLILCFIFLPIASTVDSQKDCLVSFCGKNKNLPIRYPFQLEGKDQRQKGCTNPPPFNLKCTHQNTPILHLPSSGDLHIRSIDYPSRTVRLYDPNGCLPSRLMNSNVASFYPLMPVDGKYQNYTFFSTCRGEAIRGSNLTTIGCLSNSTLATVLGGDEEMLRSLGCNKTVAAVIIPVRDGFGNDDLILKWDVPTCDVCPRKGPGVKKIVFWVLCFPFILGVSSYCLSCSVYLCQDLIKWARGQARAHPQLPITSTNTHVNPQTANDEGTNKCSSIVIIGESGRVACPNEATCAICLDDYSPREIVKCIPKCKHCFHAKCIDEWLKAHSSCPVCRNLT